MKSVCVHVRIFPMQPLYLWSLILSEFIGIMEAKERSKKKKPPSDFTWVRLCPGSPPQTVSWDSTFWVIFSSCFADCSWLRYSSTLKLAVVNFSCNAFTSGLSAFEEKNLVRTQSAVKNRSYYDPQIQQNLLPDPWKCIPYFLGYRGSKNRAIWLQN